EALQDPQLKARNMIVEMEHPKLGKIRNVASPIKYSRTALKIRRFAPQIGQDTIDILKSLGYNVKEIQYFKENKII
ncbi:MAG: CoA transferase, partial [Promethearchaeota archaeon]